MEDILYRESGVPIHAYNENMIGYNFLWKFFNIKNIKKLQYLIRAEIAKRTGVDIRKIVNPEINMTKDQMARVIIKYHQRKVNSNNGFFNVLSNFETKHDYFTNKQGSFTKEDIEDLSNGYDLDELNGEFVKYLSDIIYERIVEAQRFNRGMIDTNDIYSGNMHPLPDQPRCIKKLHAIGSGTTSNKGYSKMITPDLYTTWFGYNTK